LGSGGFHVIVVSWLSGAVYKGAGDGVSICWGGGGGREGGIWVLHVGGYALRLHDVLIQGSRACLGLTP